MRFLSLSSLLVAFFIVGSFASTHKVSKPDCVSFAEVTQHLGTSQCVRGTVLHVEDGRNGGKVLNFCKEATGCPFTVVVYPSDVKKVGDVRQLEGRQIEIKGTVQEHDGRAEIVLRRTQQLQGDAAFLLFPKTPTDYDVERQGHNSAGKYSHPKEAKKSDTRQSDPLSIEDPGEP
jgi:hypothetical protein